MARSTYVYVVQHYPGGPLIGTWTVKHELASWLDQGKRRDSAWHVARYHDGQPEMMSVTLDIRTLEPR
jgi:hypothetical protein